MLLSNFQTEFSKASINNIVKRSFSEKLSRAMEVISKACEPERMVLTRPIEQKYLQHASQTKYTKREDVRYRWMDLPTCKKCERVAFRDYKPGDPPAVFVEDEFGDMVKQGVYVTCPVCHYHGPPGPPVRQHVKEV